MCSTAAPSRVTPIPSTWAVLATPQVLFMECELGDVIREGWNNWGNPSNENTAFYGEFNNRCRADTTQRVGGRINSPEMKPPSQKKGCWGDF